MSGALPTLDQIDVAGKRVVVRADLNAPMKDGRITDDTRIRYATPTLVELAEKGAIVIVLTHFDRPQGKVVEKYSLAPFRSSLEARANRPVRFVPTDWTNGQHASILSAAQPGDILLMENTRFHPGEEANDAQFSRTLAGLGDIFVNDAFSVSHRAHASIEGIARLLPSFAGRGMEAELVALDRALGDPIRPVGALVGGAKVSTKIAVLENIVRRVNVLFIGGGMANTFLHAQGVQVGRSLCEPGLGPIVERILREAEAHNCAIVLPRDTIVARALKPGAPHEVANIHEIPDDAMILDVGPTTIAGIAEGFTHLQTLLWNGPVGAFEVEPFGLGTFALAKVAAQLTKSGKLLTVAGGGDTVAALAAAGVSGDFSYVSMAGGAFLEWLEGRDLPGVTILKTRRT